MRRVFVASSNSSARAASAATAAAWRVPVRSCSAVICQTTAECGYHPADYNRNVSINQILDYSIEAI